MKFTFTITAVTNTSALPAGATRTMSAYVDPRAFLTDDFGDAREPKTAMLLAINEAASRIVCRLYGRKSSLESNIGMAGGQSRVLDTNKYGTHVEGRVNITLVN